MRLVSFRDPGGETLVGRLDGERVVALEAASMLEWLGGEGRADAGAEYALAELELLAPVPEPPSVRDFFAYEDHVRTGAKLRGGEIPPAWYEIPVFYFSNPASIHGPGEPVRKPATTSLLDFELEIAAVIGAGGEIAGFTLFNDWSARDLQRQEMTVGLGPAKGKDFAISLGPWLATPDELPYRDGRLELERDRDGERPRAHPHRCSREALVMARARRPLRPRHPPAPRRRDRLGHAQPGLPARARPAGGRPLPGAGRHRDDRSRRPGRARDDDRLTTAQGV